jgi:hypothetical protein
LGAVRISIPREIHRRRVNAVACALGDFDKRFTSRGTGARKWPAEDFMQKFNSPMTPDDGRLVRRIGAIVVAIYASVALALITGVVAQIASRAPASNIATSIQGQVEAHGVTEARGQ